MILRDVNEKKKVGISFFNCEKAILICTGTLFYFLYFLGNMSFRMRKELISEKQMCHNKQVVAFLRKTDKVERGLLSLQKE